MSTGVHTILECVWSATKCSYKIQSLMKKYRIIFIILPNKYITRNLVETNKTSSQNKPLMLLEKSPQKKNENENENRKINLSVQNINRGGQIVFFLRSKVLSWKFILISHLY